VMALFEDIKAGKRVSKEEFERAMADIRRKPVKVTIPMLNWTADTPTTGKLDYVPLSLDKLFGVSDSDATKETSLKVVSRPTGDSPELWVEWIQSTLVRQLHRTLETGNCEMKLSDPVFDAASAISTQMLEAHYTEKKGDDGALWTRWMFTGLSDFPDLLETVFLYHFQDLTKFDIGRVCKKHHTHIDAKGNPTYLCEATSADPKLTETIFNGVFNEFIFFQLYATLALQTHFHKDPMDLMKLTVEAVDSVYCLEGATTNVNAFVFALGWLPEVLPYLRTNESVSKILTEARGDSALNACAHHLQELQGSVSTFQKWALPSASGRI